MRPSMIEADQGPHDKVVIGAGMVLSFELRGNSDPKAGDILPDGDYTMTVKDVVTRVDTETGKEANFYGVTLDTRRFNSRLRRSHISYEALVAIPPDGSVLLSQGEAPPLIDIHRMHRISHKRELALSIGAAVIGAGIVVWRLYDKNHPAE